LRRIDKEAKELVSGLLFDDLRALAIEKPMVTLRTHKLDQAVAKLNVTVELFPALGTGDPENVFTNRHAYLFLRKAPRRPLFRGRSIPPGRKPPEPPAARQPFSGKAR